MAIVEQPLSQKFNLGEEIGQTGLAHWYGEIQERYLSDLQGTEGIAVFNEMGRRDPSVRSIMFATKLMARTVTWQAVAPSDTPGPDAEATEFLATNLEDMSHTVTDSIDDCLSMLVFGWFWQEICYKRRTGAAGKHASQFDDGRIGWRKWAPRKQTSWYKWEFDDHGGVEGIWQWPQNERMNKQIFIPIEKSLHYTTEPSGGDPEGFSLCEPMYESWYFLKNILPVLGIGFERSFVGLPVFRWEPDAVPSNNDKAEVAAMGKALRMGEKAYAAIPSSVQFSLESAQNAVAGDILATIQYMRLLILQSALAEFINLGVGSTGSFSLGQDKSELFLMAVNGWLDKISAILNRFAVPRLFGYNEFPGLSALPMIQHTQVEKPNLQELGQFLQAIAAHIHITGEDEIWLRSRAGMPELTLEQVEEERETSQGVANAIQAQMQPEAGEEPGDDEQGEMAEFAEPDDEPPTDLGPMTDALGRALNERKAELVNRLERRQAVPGDPFWNEEERVLREVLLPQIEAQALAGATVAAEGLEALTVGVNWDIINTVVTKWAREHAGKLVSGITKISREALGEQIAAWIESGEPLPDLIGRLDKIYGPTRAELIATTEVTQAYAQGNMTAWADSGVVEGREWRAVRDERVCPICGALHGQQAALDEPFEGGFDGPPAHPRCRCFLAPVVMKP